MNRSLANIQRYLLLPAIVFFTVVIGGVWLLPSPGNVVPPKDAIALTGQSDPDLPVEIDLPPGWMVVVTNPRKRGWLQTGEVLSEILSAEDELTRWMAGRGLARRQVVDESNTHEQILVQYEGHGCKILCSLRKLDWNRTGFSWGVSR